MANGVSRIRIQDVLTRHTDTGGFNIEDLRLIGTRLDEQYDERNILSRTLREAIAVRDKSESTRRRHFPKGRFLFGAGLNLVGSPNAKNQSRTPMFGLFLAEGGRPFKNGAFGQVLIRSWIDYSLTRDVEPAKVLVQHRTLASHAIGPVNANGHANGRIPVDDLSEVEHEPWAHLHRATTSFIYGANLVIGAIQDLELADPVLTSTLIRAVQTRYNDRLTEQYRQEQAAGLPVQA